MRLPQNEIVELSESARNWTPSNSKATARLVGFALFMLILLVCFSHPLYALFDFAAHSDLYSYILLLPFISFYLVWSKRKKLTLESKPLRVLALAPFLAGVGIVALDFLTTANGGIPSVNYLVSNTFACLALFWGGCLFFFGFATLRAIAFPLLFLIFIVPLTTSIEAGLQRFLQVSSAAAAHLFFQISGTPVLQHGTAFQLPGFSFEVAPECSGIHSSLVLFITSLLAGHLLLRKLWSKALLACFVVPLAIIRNGFRILVIGELCVQVSPEMIHSYIHRRGGPIFFAGSLVPFFLLLLFLRRIESRPAVRLN